ncbi:MAG: glycosyltransferase family 2 protein [Sedimenticola sp.]
MADNFTILLTLTSALLVIYHHLGYPLILRHLSRRKEMPVVDYTPRHHSRQAGDRHLPTITLVIPAYNEQQHIADKVRNLAALDYPADRLRVIIACDGCNDATAQLAQQCAEEPECRHLDIEVRGFSQNRGKVAVINDVIGSIESSLVALSDVSALISVDALLVAANHFSTHSVGVVCGRYQLLNPGSEGEAVYWRYQSRIKAGEAALGAPLGAHGAFYMFRRKLFTPLPADTINDDFILPMQIVARGRHAIYEPAINALELEQADSNLDQQRRRRIAAGNLQQLIRLWGMLRPKHKGVAFAFASGKALRVLMPLLLLITLFGSLWLAQDYRLFQVMALTQVLIYTLAVGYHFGHGNMTNKLLDTLDYLVSGHLAGLIGSWNYLTGHHRRPWQRVGIEREEQRS